MQNLSGKGDDLSILFQTLTESAKSGDVSAFEQESEEFVRNFESFITAVRRGHRSVVSQCAASSVAAFGFWLKNDELRMALKAISR